MSTHCLWQRMRAALACVCLLLAAGPAALAAGPSGRVSPKLRVGPMASLAVQPGSAGGPNYGLRTCQVGLSIGQCYDPYQMRTAYQLDQLIAGGYDGSGQTIVIVDAFQHPNLATQLDTFDSYYGLPAIQLTQVAPDGLTPFDPNDGNMVGWAEEISLDVEWAHAIAPGAKIVLVLAKSNEDADIVSALKYAVDHRLGKVVSMSFGENESCLSTDLMQAYHQIFANATMAGITLFASSGDEGAANTTCDGNSWVKSVSSPASDPLVTAVGGTELRAADFCLSSLGCNPSSNPAPGTWKSEIAWNEGDPYGDFGNVFGEGTLSTGGGYSVVFAEPPYQQNTIHGGKQRAVPDVAYNAAVLHGVLTRLDIPGVAPGWYRFGGTSAGAPQWAAITAIANQRAGHPLGFLNAALYQMGHVKPTYPITLHDITSGTNSSLQFDANNNPVDITGYDAGTGWDATTGYGSPIGPGLVDTLISFVSPGDGMAAVSTTRPRPNPKPVGPGSVRPH
jgi:subtilase family serine protease